MAFATIYQHHFIFFVTCECAEQAIVLHYTSQAGPNVVKLLYP
jgi:hypothetical protein